MLAVSVDALITSSDRFVDILCATKYPGKFKKMCYQKYTSPPSPHTFLSLKTLLFIFHFFYPSPFIPFFSFTALMTCTMEEQFEHVNVVNFEELVTLHKEALTVVKNQTILVNNVLKDHKLTNLETLNIICDQVNTVQKVLEVQDSTLKILSQQVSYTTSDSASTSITLYTSQNTPLSKLFNWILPFGKYTDPCLVCSYYGHGFRECPNLCKGFLGSCIQCWSPEHDFKSCKLLKYSLPFKDGYRNPEQLIESLGTFDY